MTIKEKIDRLGEIRELKNEEKKILAELKEELRDVGIYQGNVYDLEVSEASEADIIPEKAEAALGKNFIKCVKVLKTKAQEYLPLEQIDKICGEPRTILKFKPVRREK